MKHFYLAKLLRKYVREIFIPHHNLQEILLENMTFVNHKYIFTFNSYDIMINIEIHRNPSALILDNYEF